MNTKMILLGALAVTLAAGPALAVSGNTPGGQLNDPTRMAPFYTDSTMKTLKTDDEFKAVWLALTKEDRHSMMTECSATDVSPEHNDFCVKAKTFGEGD